MDIVPPVMPADPKSTYTRVRNPEATSADGCLEPIAQLAQIVMNAPALHATRPTSDAAMESFSAAALTSAAAYSSERSGLAGRNGPPKRQRQDIPRLP